MTNKKTQNKEPRYVGIVQGTLMLIATGLSSIVFYGLALFLGIFYPMASKIGVALVVIYAIIMSLSSIAIMVGGKR